jgi:hypothetical protein
VRQAASPEEAAAIAAAIEQFMRDTAPAAGAARRARDESRGCGPACTPAPAATRRGPTPWGEPERWGTG